MSSLPGGFSVGNFFKMSWSSSTRETVPASLELICLGTASCREGVPSGRTAEVMVSVSWFKGCVTVKTKLGVGGAKPPVIPSKFRVFELAYYGSTSFNKMCSTFLQSQ